MIEYIIAFVGQFPTWLATILLASLPVTELRVAIPVAAQLWLIDPLNVYALAIIGNLLPFIPLFFGLEKVRDFLEKRFPPLANIIDTSIERAHRRVQEKYEKYGALSLFLFTALPLPLTGLWTATLAAVALKVPFKYAAMGIISGILTSGVIVSILTISADVFF